MKKWLFVIVILLFTLSFQANAMPQQINFQGRLISSDAMPIKTPTDITLKLFGSPSGFDQVGSSIDNKTVYPDNNGIFSTTLEFDPSYFDGGGSRYLEVWVGTEKLSPRQQIVSVPYAYRAITAESLAGGLPTGPTGPIGPTGPTGGTGGTGGNGNYVSKTGDKVTGTLTLEGSANLLVNGKVGIGTTSPGDKLDIAGKCTIEATGNIKTSGTISEGGTLLSGKYIGIPGGSARGDILMRDASSWTRLAAGTSGQYLQTQGAGGNPVWATVSAGLGGSGTTGYISKFTDSNTIGNSVIYESGGKLSIGTANPLSLITIYTVSDPNTIPAQLTLWDRNSAETSDGDSAGAKIVFRAVRLHGFDICDYERAYIIGKSNGGEAWGVLDGKLEFWTSRFDTMGKKMTLDTWGHLYLHTGDLIVSNGKITVSGAGDSSFVGKVGIGTTGPGYSLDVQGGDINTSGNVSEGGTILSNKYVGIPGSSAQGDILIRDASNWTRLSAGTSGQYLKTQGAGANPIWAASSGLGGSGTASYLARFTGASTVGNSAIYDDGSNVGIGTVPSYRLHVIDSRTSNDDPAICGNHSNHPGYGIGVTGYGGNKGMYAYGGVYGLWGHADNDSLTPNPSVKRYGVYGETASTYNNAYGVYGSVNSGANGTTYGVYGDSQTTSGNTYGVYGDAKTMLGTAYGVYGKATSDLGTTTWAGYFEGKLKTTDTSGTNHVYDVAELIPCAKNVEAGDVVTVNPNKYREAIKAAKAYDHSMVGIISADPQFSIGDKEKANKEKPGKNFQFIALAGQVPVKVDASYGPIKPGDLLTSSPDPGYAMKATEAGSTVGVALESFDGSKGKTGKILCFASLGGRNLENALKDLKAENDKLKTEMAELKKTVKRIETQLRPATK